MVQSGVSNLQLYHPYAAAPCYFRKKIIIYCLFFMLFLTLLITLIRIIIIICLPLSKLQALNVHIRKALIPLFYNVGAPHFFM